MKRLILFFIVLGSVISNYSAYAQWLKITNFDAGVTGVYFHEFQDSLLVGFVGTRKLDGFYGTRDGGKSWTAFQSFGDENCFAFKDSLVGWAGNGSNSLRKTSDGGVTWGKVTTFPVTGLYYNRTNTQLFISSSSGAPLSSSDEGSTIVSLPGFSNVSDYCGIAFINDLIGIITHNHVSGSSLFTADGGLTWQSSSFFNECWQPHVSTPSNTFYCPGEFTGGGLWKSTDFGSTWYRPFIANLGAITGHMQGNDCRLYIHAKQGVFRSLDTGHTWQFIGGPGNIPDTRALFVKDRQIYAGGEDGSLWYLYDTAADARDLRMLISKTTINFDTVAECSSPKQTIHFHNYRQCDSLRLLKVELATLPPALSYSLSNVGKIPRRIEPESGDSLVVEFTQVGLGKYISQVKITFLIDGRVVDTIISVTGVRVPSGKATASPTLVNFDTISFCSEQEDTVILKHNGCDSATAELLYVPPSIFNIVSPIFPIRLGPGEQVPVRVKYKPQSLGAVNDDIIFAVKIDGTGQQQGVTVKLTGTAEKLFTVPGIDPAILIFPQMTICDTGRVLKNLTFTNPSGCDSVMIRTVDVDSMNFRSETSAASYSLSPGLSQTLSYSFTQTGKGNYTFRVPIQYFDGKEWLDTVLSAIADVSEGTRILSTSHDTLDFGTTTLCEERDSVLTLRNTGCDTLRITNVDLSGKGFITNTSTSIIIPPGDSITIPVSTKVDTSQGNVSTGAITITSNADNQVFPITLYRGYTPPKSYSLHLGMPIRSGTSDDIVRLAIVGEQGLGSTNSGVNRLDFDLSLNEDLLEYITFEGQNQVTKNGNHISIINPVELTSNNDTLAILRYHVFLTKDSVTDISLSNLTLNNNDTSACAPKIASQTSEGFTYRYECGDRHIQSFLRTGQASLEITSIRPNPAKDKVFIDLSSSSETACTVRIIDIDGKVHYQIPYKLRSGSQQLYIRTPHISEGSYFIQIITSSFSTSQKLQIVK